MSTSILIVEDNIEKQIEICKALAGLGEMLTVRSITDAFRLVGERHWDLIILDMTFLVDRSSGKESGRQSMAGVELLQFMAQRRRTFPVIIATQHEYFASAEVGEINGLFELHNLLFEVFPESYRATVKVDQSEEAWKVQLHSAATNILESRA